MATVQTTPFMAVYDELSALNDEENITDDVSSSTDKNDSTTIDYTKAIEITQNYYKKLIEACITINRNVGINQTNISASGVLLCLGLDSQNLKGLAGARGIAVRYPAAGGGDEVSLHILTQAGAAIKNIYRLKGELKSKGSFNDSQSWLIFCISGDDAIINASADQVISLLGISTSAIKPQIIISPADGLRSATWGYQQGPKGKLLIGVPYKATSAEIPKTFCNASTQVDVLANNSTNEIYHPDLAEDWPTNFLKNLLNYKAPTGVQTVYYQDKAIESIPASVQINWPEVAIHMPTLIDFYIASLKTSQAKLVKGQLKAFLHLQSDNRVTIGPQGSTPHHSLQYLYNGMMQEGAIDRAKISGLKRNGGATQLQTASDETKYQYLVSKASGNTDFVIKYSSKDLGLGSQSYGLDTKVLVLRNPMDKKQDIQNTHNATYVLCFAIDGLGSGGDSFVDTSGTWLLFKKQENSSNNSTSYDKIVKATNECEENILNALSRLESTLPFVKLSN